jgi:hypothetical protein
MTALGLKQSNTLVPQNQWCALKPYFTGSVRICLLLASLVRQFAASAAATKGGRKNRSRNKRRRPTFLAPSNLNCCSSGSLFGNAMVSASVQGGHLWMGQSDANCVIGLVPQFLTLLTLCCNHILLLNHV